MGNTRETGKKNRLLELQNRDKEIEALKASLTPEMDAEQVAAIYPAFSVLMVWASGVVGANLSYGEFLNYYEGKKEYPKRNFVKRFAS